MKFLIMDHTGHSTREFDEDNPLMREEAKKIFVTLIEQGNTAATREAGAVDYKVIRDPADCLAETLFIPRMKGG